MPSFIHKRNGSQEALLIPDGKSEKNGVKYGTIFGARKPGKGVGNEAHPASRSLKDLYRFATAGDVAMIVLGVLAAIVSGAGLPMMSILFGGMSNSFITMGKIPDVMNNNLTEIIGPAISSAITTVAMDVLTQSIITYSAYYAYMGLFILVSSYIQTACWMITCERQIHRIRKEFFRSILRQEIAWFDEKQSGELTTQLSDNLDRVKEGIGDKFGLLLQYSAQMVVGFVIAFIYNWKLTLIMMSLTPFMAGLGTAMYKVISKATKQEQAQYGVAGAVAEEVLSCVRTVLAFNGQKQDCQRYEQTLKVAKAMGIRKALIQGFVIGSVMFLMFCSYALALWFGARLIVWKEITPGTVFVVLMAVMSGTMSLGTMSPQFAVLAAAKGAASVVFDIIDAKPEIDPYSSSGIQLENLRGEIEFSNVFFSYPTRKDVTVLNDVSFSVQPGQCVALVGSSGSGKSTVVNLLLRYYDAKSGQVSLDGENIKSLNLHWLRNMMAVVSQEPVLFDATVEENIGFGREDATKAEVIAAAKMANAHDFISSLPEGYKTRVGERGVQLSGGQKQRIAIARALVRRPKILLLDEATSALDATSEGLVQEALDVAREGRTTIVIAHRLSTIRSADKIVALKDGRVSETGTHEELMEKRGVYYQLVTAQTFESSGDGPPPAQSGENDVFKSDTDTDFSDAGPVSSRRATAASAGVRRKLTAGSGYSSGTDQDQQANRKLTRLLSAVETEKARLEREAKEEHAERSTVLAIMKENKPEWLAITLGLVGAALRGVAFPVFALFYSQMFEVYSKEGDELLNGSSFWSGMMVVMGVVMCLGILMSVYFYGISSEELTMRLRLKAFTNILRQDGSYFDQSTHASGKLCTRLATDAPAIKGAVDNRLGTLLSSVISMIAGIAIGFLFGWQLTLLMLLILPLFALGTYFRLKGRYGRENRDALLLESAGQTAAEAIGNIRTVQSLTREIPMYHTFCRYLDRPYKQALRHTQSQAVSYAFSQCVVFFFYAACFRFGAYLITIGQMQPLDIFKVFFVIMFSGMTIGWATAYFPEMIKARIAAGLIMKIMNERPQIDSYSATGLKKEYKGSVVFDNVYFSYPTRPKAHVLRGVSFQVPPGNTVALVGSSGCGKSTIVNLLERFYDPIAGRVLIDDNDLRTYNLQFSREQIALVSQEPTLFDCSIFENISYGMSSKVAHETVIEAAKLANMHDFIMGLPEGYATRVGEKGIQLSGGQKQRIAIARALVREPKIILLDEATSALDTESEKIVQEALDRARQGRTSIVIAHRLSTVQNADRILVLKHGQIVEEGTHSELINKRKYYYELTKKQRLFIQ